jgi:GH18 family chitinase
MLLLREYIMLAWRRIGWMLAVLWCGTGELGADVIAVTQKPRIVGYLPDYRMVDYTSDRLAGVTDLVAFSAVLTAEGRIDTSRIPAGQFTRMRIWKRDLELRLLLCVGGWDRSQGFAKASANAELRKSFIEQAVRLCLDEGLDGLDLDWEHPEGAAEQAAYGELLTEMRRAFDGKQLELSIAVAPWQQLPQPAWQAPHRIHLMAYDNPGRHATLDDARMALNKMRKAGVKPEQLVLGIPLYGRGVVNRDLVKTWAQIAVDNPQPDQDQLGDLYYNGPTTVAAKARLARGLGGVMVWELGQDGVGERSLVKKIRTELDRVK